MSLWMQMGPICAVTPGAVHACEPAYRSKRRTVDTACGRKRAKIMGLRVVDADGSPAGAITVKWPPKVADIAPDKRCRECLQVVPGKAQPFPQGPLTSFGPPR